MVRHVNRAVTSCPRRDQCDRVRSEATRMPDLLDSLTRRAALLRTLASNAASTVAGAGLGMANALRDRVIVTHSGVGSRP